MVTIFTDVYLLVDKIVKRGKRWLSVKNERDCGWVDKSQMKN